MDWGEFMIDKTGNREAGKFWGYNTFISFKTKPSYSPGSSFFAYKVKDNYVILEKGTNANPRDFNPEIVSGEEEAEERLKARVRGYLQREANRRKENDQIIQLLTEF